MAGDPDSMAPRLQQEASGGRIEVGQAQEWNGEAEPLLLTGLQTQPLKADQRSPRPLQQPPRRLRVDLNHLSSGHRADVGHRDRHLQHVCFRIQLHLQIGVAEVAVREAESEGESSAMAITAQAPVAMPQVVDDAGRTGLKGRQLRFAAGHRKGHAATG